jgi:murein DD-endopeptidase MepM/ murein hydrolase activator NlpD
MSRTRSRLLASAAPLAVVALVLGSAARAQVGDGPLPIPTTVPDPTSTTSSTPSTTAPRPTTTTTTPRLTTTTTKPVVSSVPPPAPETTVAPPGGGDGPASGGPVPPEYQGAINSIQRTPANNTRRLLDALRPLVDLGYSEAEAVQLGFGPFPVGGDATWSDDWWFPRHVPSFHLHEGTDIFAPYGTPVRSPVDGILKHSEGSIGGLAAYVYEPDGTYHYLAHLSGFVPGQVSGQAVRAGEVVGYNGTSGNAVGTPPHVHYEIHPAPKKDVTSGKGKTAATTTVTVAVPMGTQLPAAPPKPYLDRWVEEAMANVPKVIAQAEAGRPRAILATGLTRRLSDGGGMFAAPTGPPRAQLLWASSASPSGGALRLAEAEAAAVVDELGYAALAKDEEARIRAYQAELRWGAALLAPLTPPLLRQPLGLGPPPTFSLGSSRTGEGGRSLRL